MIEQFKQGGFGFSIYITGFPDSTPYNLLNQPGTAELTELGVAYKDQTAKPYDNPDILRYKEIATTVDEGNKLLAKLNPSLTRPATRMLTYSNKVVNTPDNLPDRTTSYADYEDIIKCHNKC
jgi:hypothetical protein